MSVLSQSIHFEVLYLFFDKFYTYNLLRWCLMIRKTTEFTSKTVLKTTFTTRNTNFFLIGVKLYKNKTNDWYTGEFLRFPVVRTYKWTFDLPRLQQVKKITKNRQVSVQLLKEKLKLFGEDWTYIPPEVFWREEPKIKEGKVEDNKPLPPPRTYLHGIQFDHFVN